MTLRGLLYVLLVACVTGVSSSSAQSNPGGAATPSRAVQQDIDRLLQRESDALDLYQKQVAPAIRCDQADKNYRESCRSMRMTLTDTAERAKQDIVVYRTSRQPVDLFNNYVDLQFLLKHIEFFGLAEQYNEDLNHQPLATAYNTFVKLTEGWFTGEMREVIRTLAH